MLEIGSTFAHYRIEGLLGAGGMGEVYLALDDRLQRQVALKVLQRATADDAARMVREARAAAAVEHPNKVTVFELGQVDGAPYIAMELIRGRTLRALVDTAGDRRWEAALSVLLDAARALESAHAAGLIHRDVKPENVMIREDGIVKVLDFGIARRSATSVDSLASTAMDTSGVVVGTPAYMAPEQVRGEPLDGRCDQFAWGIMAFEVLAGEHPWATPGGGALQLVSTMLTRPPRDLCELRPGIPGGVGSAIRRSLSPDRDDRFPSMDALVAALEPPLGRSDRRVRMPPEEGDVSASAPTVAARPEPRTTGAVAVPPVTASGLPTGWRVLAGVLIVACLGAAFAVVARDGGDAGSDAAPPASAAPSASTLSPSPIPSALDAVAARVERPPLRHLCHPDVMDRNEYGLKTLSCGKDARAWCDASGKTIACCAFGLVASGRDGACMCPPLPDDDGRALGCSDAEGVPAPDPAGFARRGDQVRIDVGRCFAGSKAARALLLHFWVDYTPEGEVASARILRSDAQDPAMQACALKALQDLDRWPNRGGSGALEMKWHVGDGAPAKDAP